MAARGTAGEGVGEREGTMECCEGEKRAGAEGASRVGLWGNSDRVGDSEDLRAWSGIVEVQRTGRVGLPKLGGGVRLRALPNQSQAAGQTAGKAG